MPKKLILFIGAPGAGKSTDCAIVAEKHIDDISAICLSDLIKEEIAKGSAVGNIMKSYVNSGDLIPGDIIIYEVFDLIKNAPKNIVLLDGLPRGLNQMKGLGDAIFNEPGIELVSVIEIRVSKETSRKRILRENASDEETKLFEHKMEVHEELIGAIENFYNKDGLLTIIDGEQDKEAVVADIEEYFNTQISLFNS